MADWITTEEAREISGYNVAYLRELIRTEKITAQKKGGAYWVDKQSLLAYIDAAKQTGDRRHGSRKKATS
ncbi:MAG: helix-turn-helix domain-containing protein [Candidatus Marsarchaeota archaeon]|nr:helix-turn-helix domain-containing protein [Candidatus Marsarchaeota archaeon]